MKRLYLHIALILCGLSFFFAGVVAAEIAWTSEIEAVRDWEKGYRYGYRKCQQDVFYEHGIRHRMK